MSREVAPYVIGVGSSAGGIEALIRLVASLPKNLDASVVIAQHLSPSHKSQMAEILSRETDYSVEEARDKIKVEVNHVYVGPPGFHIRYSGGLLFLETEPSDVSPKPSVDLLFESLADELGDHAVGIVLSGTGSDGSRGVKAIKGVGGFVMVHEPENAKYNGMPKSALTAVEADKILLPEQMGAELATITNSASHAFFPPSSEARSNLMSILYDKVRDATKIDFTFYKQSTLLRRVNRRLIATQRSNLTDYISFIEANPDEISYLAKELLISVTDFFRDKEAFEAISDYIREIVENKVANQSIRLWIAGCATGEEAYSLTMLFLDEIRKQNKELTLQVFATDIDEHALAVARKGAYNKLVVKGVKPELLERYFQLTKDHYQPKKTLRDCITFSRQDITRDPPFLHLDMISFRNVLIYFNSELQQRVLSLFRYSLTDRGILFLGKSESIGAREELFVPVDRRSRIFKVSEFSQRPALPKMIRGAVTPPRHKPTTTNSYERLFNEAVLKAFGPSILINGNFNILHTYGRLRDFVNFPDGVPELNLSKLVTAECSAELVTTVNKAKRSGEIAFSHSLKIESLSDQLWQLVVFPLDEKDPELFLVNFRKHESTGEVIEAPREYDKENPDVAELIAAREQLQTLTEEMAASAEEMQALNEEVQAANEELQANNEELEATNEELQATNEELISVNEESMRKSSQLTAVNSELISLYNTLDFPILVFNSQLELSRANDCANRRFHLNTGTYGKKLNELNLPAYFADIETSLAKVVSNGLKGTTQLQPSAKETFDAQLTPILGNQDSVNGVVVVLIDNSELAMAKEAIEKSQEQLLSIMNNSPAVIALKDNSGRYEFVNRRFEEIFGLNEQQVLGKTDLQLFDAEMAKQLRDKDLDTMRSLSVCQSVDEMDTPQGTLYFESVRFPTFDSEGTIRSICTQSNDVTKARHGNQQIKLAGKLFDHAGEAILITDADETILTSNSAFCEFTGFELNDIIGKKPGILASGRHSDAFFESIRTTLEQQGYWRGEIINRVSNGDEVPMWVTINRVLDVGGEHVNYVATYSDINEIKSAHRKIEFLASHDELTKLPNRNAMLERLELMVNTAKREGHLVAVLFFDLDDFKTINDTLGHNIGDQLLMQVTSRLHKCIRDTDLLARLGGDEFVALLTAHELDEIDQVAKRIIALISTPFEVNEHTLFVSASVGVSVFPEDSEDYMQVLKNADTAMYRAKELGRNQYQYFTQQMKQDAAHKMAIENGLRQALSDRCFKVQFQPQIDIKTNRVLGAEALLRCDIGELKTVPVQSFIEVAEKGRLIEEVGIQALELVFEAIGNWQQDAESSWMVSVNISSKQLKNIRFPSMVKALLERYQVNPKRIKFEITESTLMERLDKISGVLDQLVEMGIKLSVDDFGVGYSSLSYLRKLPIEEIKIDRSFIESVVNEADSKAITSSIVKMGQALGLRVVAEGVESESQFDHLKAMGCEVVQGFYFYQPMTAAALWDLLRTQNDQAQKGK